MKVKAFLVCVFVAVLVALFGGVIDDLLGIRFEAGVSGVGILIHNVIYMIVGNVIFLGVVFLRDSHRHVSAKLADMYMADTEQLSGDPLLNEWCKCPECQTILDAAQDRWLQLPENKAVDDSLRRYLGEARRRKENQ